MGMGMKSFLVGSVPYAAMVVVQCLQVGITTLSKAALSQGASFLILVLYPNAIASLILLPSFFLNRTNRPPLTFAFLWKVFLLGLVGTTLMQNCTISGVRYSSPTLVTAISNLSPGFTFVLAVIFRMEKLDLRSLRSQIKIMGTLVSIAGAFIITLYKGPPIAAVFIQHQPQPSNFSLLAATNNWVIGGILLAIASSSIAVGNVFQSAILKGYPSEVTLVFFISLFGTIQCAVVALIAERNPNAWKIKPDIELVTVIYTAVFGGVVSYGVIAWCLRRKGPVFVAMFNPVGMFIAAFMSDIFLGETLRVGSVIGATVIVTGFYGVMWAQSKEEENSEVNKDFKPELSPQKAPLLEDNVKV